MTHHSSLTKKKERLPLFFIYYRNLHTIKCPRYDLWRCSLRATAGIEGANKNYATLLKVKEERELNPRGVKYRAEDENAAIKGWIVEGRVMGGMREVRT
jgi:hypothetical protein